MAKVVLYIKSIIMLMYLLKIMVDMIIAMGGIVLSDMKIQPSHSSLSVSRSQKCAIAMNREEEIMSKNSHIDWSAMA